MNEMQKQQEMSDYQMMQLRQAGEFAMTQAGQMAKEFEVMQRKGAMFAQSTIVPDTYRGNVGNCVIALEMAQRMNAMPLMIMQNLYIVHGKPAFSSKFLIASINASGRFSPLRYEFKGEEGKPDYGCRCYAYESTDRQHAEPLYGDWITLDMAQKEGWMTNSGSKWKSMPNQMLRYRAAAFWQRVYCPEISMGIMTAEEAEDITDLDYNERTNTYEPAGRKQTRREAMRAAMEEQEATPDSHQPITAHSDSSEQPPMMVDTETGELFPEMSNE